MSRHAIRDAVIRIGGVLFRWRGWTPVPLLLAGVVLGRPTPASLLAGLAVTAVGEWLRCRAVAHIGSVSRTRGDGVGPLITDGPFARSRNPIYLGNLLVGAGMVWASGVPLLIAAYALLFGAQYHAIVAWEESRLLATHGDRFRSYRARVPRWFPVVRRPGAAVDAPEPGGAGAGGRALRRVLRSERSTIAVQIAVFAALLLSYLFI